MPATSLTHSRLERAFERYHHEHPEVYRMIDEHARKLVTRGFRRASMVMIFELIRYARMLETGKPFPIPNNTRPYYARLWMRHNGGTRLFATSMLRSRVKEGSKR